MVDGTVDCACNQGTASARQMFAVADGLGEGCKEVGTSLWEDVIKEIIVAVLHVFKELLPAFSHAIRLGVCTSNRCASAGSCCSSAVSQKAVVGGRGLIRKLFESWLGTADERRDTR